ncbi:MAG TPA: Lsr2 family protein [Pseudonocardiaceae bacterium]|nr:Lsr2 family protein [Pseudonocardiaceae bacterium]
MASKTVVELFDDLDGGRADETVGFALDGVDYEIDLSAANAAALRGALAEFISHAHRVPARRAAKPKQAAAKGTPGAGPSASMTAEIRRLASESAKKVSEAQQPVTPEAMPIPAVAAVPALPAQPSDNHTNSNSDQPPLLVIPFQEAGL